MDWGGLTGNVSIWNRIELIPQLSKQFFSLIDRPEAFYLMFVVLTETAHFLFKKKKKKKEKKRKN